MKSKETIKKKGNKIVERAYENGTCVICMYHLLEW